MKVLGIDPGSLITGYGLVEKGAHGAHIPLSHGRISLKASAPLPSRLLELSRQLEAVIEEFRPQILSIESVFFAKNARSSLVLGHARAVPLLLAASHDMEIFEYAPRQIKLAITGFGGATKTQVQKMAGSLLHIKDMPGPDASDALAVALCHLFRFADGVREKPCSKKAKSWRQAVNLKNR